MKMDLSHEEPGEVLGLDGLFETTAGHLFSVRPLGFASLEFSLRNLMIVFEISFVE